MAITLNKITAPDNYTPAATIDRAPIQAIILNVVNQAIFWQLQIQGIWEENADTLSLPGSTPISSDRPDEITGFRFKASVPLASLPAGAVQAIVSVRTSP